MGILSCFQDFFYSFQNGNIELAVQFYLTLNSVFRMVNLRQSESYLLHFIAMGS